MENWNKGVSTPLHPVDHKLLALLEADARISNAELGRRLGISATTVAERINRLHETGVIRQYRTIINPASVNRGLCAIIEMTPFQPDFEKVVGQIRQMREVVHCYRVTGTAFLILFVRVASGEALNAFLMELTKVAHTKTSIVLSAEFEDRPLVAQPAATTRLAPAES
ncbi:MAG: Lrp/AsnC family transcriptional regulator [Caulobacteraceae bacterium]